MEDNALTVSFEDSLNEDITGYISELAEVGLDRLFEAGSLKDIPFLSTVVGIYHIGKTLRERNHIKNLILFLDEINRSACDDEKKQKYIEKLKDREKYCDKEIEYILIVLERYIGQEKPKMLAKIYLAYLDERITWDDFARYAEVIDRFLPGDYNVLSCFRIGSIHANNKDIDAFQRLTALGLMREDKSMDTYIKEKYDDALWVAQPEQLLFRRTEFGDQLYLFLELGEKL